MRTRREFLSKTMALAALSSAPQNLPAKDGASPQPLRLLILGGTGTTGRYYVRAALDRGHRVAVFSRGRTPANLPSNVELLVGDRNSDLESIKNRDWDAVIDVATFGPGWVRSLGEALKGRVGHYTFISTVSVYDNPAGNAQTTEDSPVLAWRSSIDPYSITQEGDYYGAAKVLCEEEARKQFPGRTLILRPGYIGGPDDTHGILTFWALRAEKSGPILAAGDPATPVQFIDVRDLGEWMVRLVEKRAAGTYNAIGPQSTQAQLIDAALHNAGQTAGIEWVPRAWLDARKDRQFWGTLLFWEINKGYLTRISNSKAMSNGFKIRPLGTTLADTLSWYRQLPPDRQADIVTGFRKRENGPGFEEVHASWPVYLDHEAEALAAWKAAQVKKS
jgi:2'-hydroxyisoflavone reductase